MLFFTPLPTPNFVRKNQMMETTKYLDVTVLQPRLKHPTIFQWFDNLPEGDNFILVNDHDPIPLYYQFEAERKGQFDWNYIERGPDVFKVQIAKLPGTTSVAEIVLDNPNAAAVLKKYRIDFCCGGKKKLRQVCEEKGLDYQAIADEIEATEHISEYEDDFSKWEVGSLVDYILDTHHTYTRRVLNELSLYINKVVRVHGEGHPELGIIQVYFTELLAELESHMEKEEQILFPYFKKLAEAEKNKSSLEYGDLRSILPPVQVMEIEHEQAGRLLEKIRMESSDYTPPEQACTTYRLTYKLLEEFENDLHNHIHLENNILFPKALNMEEKLR